MFPSQRIVESSAEQAPKTDKTFELYDRPRLRDLERTSRFRRCARYPKLGRFNAEDEGWDDHSVELGE